MYFWVADILPEWSS